MRDVAAPGSIWLCMMCGKTARDPYGSEGGWDESCACNSLLVDEATRQPTQEQVDEFHAKRNAFLSCPRPPLGGPIDPELLEMAEQIVRERGWDKE